MREIKYIVLHHSATDCQANKDDIDGVVIAKTICDRARGHWSKESIQIINAIITTLSVPQAKSLQDNL